MNVYPYHRRLRPTPQKFTLFEFNRIDLRFASLPPYPKADPSSVLPDSRPLANSIFDARAAAAVSASVGDPTSVHPDPAGSLLELNVYAHVAPAVYILTPKCLAAMAYEDYFPDAPHGKSLRSKVSAAIMKAGPGWCGTFGPGVSDQGSSFYEGNYDFAQMFIIPLVYSYYDVLTPQAYERAITLLLGSGRISRASLDDTLTSGVAPNDWSRAGYVSVVANLRDIPETENHVLMIATTRYLANQLLYQRDQNPGYDNRRNGHHEDATPSCMEQVLGLLRNYLRDDFAEYNAKNYQEETRHALLNLCTYAYDAEVRLGARMVLDYVSAHIAVSSNDLRRMVPFRRRNEGVNVQLLPGSRFMDVSLLDAHGADPMPAQFALLAGNTRAYQKPNNRIWPDNTSAARPWYWAITPNFAPELTLGAVSAYRLPPSVHDLFVNDLHRRFFQRIHRHPLEEPGQQRNCDNMEIYSGSPSYLISAGGRPADHAIPGVGAIGQDETNLGVAVPTSFMPTGLSAGTRGSLRQLVGSTGMPARPLGLKTVAQVFGFSAPFSLRALFTAAGFYINTNNARDLIQFSAFSDTAYDESDDQPGVTENYGVAPDFACGYQVHLPVWTGVPHDQDGRFFINRKSHDDELAGFFLFIYKSQNCVIMEAFDTWLHPEIGFEQFQEHVTRDNPNIDLQNNKEAVYTTFVGNKIHFVIWGDDWNNPARDHHREGALILGIEYGTGAPFDTLVDAGNDTDESQFLTGSVLKSPGDAVVEIHNSFLGTQLRLDWQIPDHLVRRSEDGEVEHAGKNAAGQLFEVWVDFDWNGPREGDFYRPFNRLADAMAAVADGGVIKIAPGTTRERTPILHGKRVRLVAPIGGVTIGGR